MTFLLMNITSLLYMLHSLMLKIEQFFFAQHLFDIYFRFKLDQQQKKLPYQPLSSKENDKILRLMRSVTGLVIGFGRHTMYTYDCIGYGLFIIFLHDTFTYNKKSYLHLANGLFRVFCQCFTRRKHQSSLRFLAFFFERKCFFAYIHKTFRINTSALFYLSKSNQLSQ